MGLRRATPVLIIGMMLATGCTAPPGAPPVPVQSPVAPNLSWAQALSPQERAAITDRAGKAAVSGKPHTLLAIAVHPMEKAHQWRVTTRVQFSEPEYDGQRVRQSLLQHGYFDDQTDTYLPGGMGALDPDSIEIDAAAPIIEEQVLKVFQIGCVRNLELSPSWDADQLYWSAKVISDGRATAVGGTFDIPRQVIAIDAHAPEPPDPELSLADYCPSAPL